MKNKAWGMARGEGKPPSNQSWVCRYLTQKTLDKTLTKKMRQEYLSATLGGRRGSGSIWMRNKVA